MGIPHFHVDAAFRAILMATLISFRGFVGNRLITFLGSSLEKETAPLLKLFIRAAGELSPLLTWLPAGDRVPRQGRDVAEPSYMSLYVRFLLAAIASIFIITHRLLREGTTLVISVSVELDGVPPVSRFPDDIGTAAARCLNPLYVG